MEETTGSARLPATFNNVVFIQSTFTFDYKTKAWVDSMDVNVGKYSLSWVTAGDESVELLHLSLIHI